MSPCCIFRQCNSLSFIPISKLCCLTITGQNHSIAVFKCIVLIVSYHRSPPCSYTQELVGTDYLSFFRFCLGSMVLQPQHFGDVHLCLLGGCCSLMLVLTTLLLITQDLCEPASVQNSFYGRCVLLSIEFCRSMLHSVVILVKI